MTHQNPHYLASAASNAINLGVLPRGLCRRQLRQHRGGPSAQGHVMVTSGGRQATSGRNLLRLIQAILWQTPAILGQKCESEAKSDAMPQYIRNVVSRTNDPPSPYRVRRHAPSRTDTRNETLFTIMPTSNALPLHNVRRLHRHDTIPRRRVPPGHSCNFFRPACSHGHRWR